MYDLLHRKNKTINKGTIYDTSNLQPEERIHVEFEFYNVTSIRGFTSMVTAIHENTRMLWVFPTTSNR